MLKICQKFKYHSGSPVLKVHGPGRTGLLILYTFHTRSNNKTKNGMYDQLINIVGPNSIRTS